MSEMRVFLNVDLRDQADYEDLKQDLMKTDLVEQVEEFDDLEFPIGCVTAHLHDHVLDPEKVIQEIEDSCGTWISHIEV